MITQIRRVLVLRRKGLTQIKLLLLLVMLLAVNIAKVFAQDMIFSPRENMIFVTLNQMQEREEAVSDAMKEAQLKQLESNIRKVRSERVQVELSAARFKNPLKNIHPYLSQSTQFNENVYARIKDRKGRFTYTNTIGARRNFVKRGKTLNLDLHINDNRSQNLPHDNTQDVAFDSLGNLFIGRYVLSLTDSVSSNYIGKVDEFGIKTDTLTYHWANTFGTKLSRSFNRVGFDLGYTRADDFNEPDFTVNNNISGTYSLNSYLRIGAKTKLVASCSHGNVEYTHKVTPSRDNNSNTFGLSLSGVLSPKMTGVAQMNYNLGNNPDAAHTRGRTFTTNIAYAFTQRTNLALSYSHTINQSSTKSDYSVADSFGLTANHRLGFNPKFNFSFNSGVSNTSNPKKDIWPTHTENVTYALGLGLSYAFRQWLDFSLNWNYTKQEDNTSTSYHKNVFIFNTQARF